MGVVCAASGLSIGWVLGHLSGGVVLWLAMTLVVLGNLAFGVAQWVATWPKDRGWLKVPTKANRARYPK